MSIKVHGAARFEATTARAARDLRDMREANARVAQYVAQQARGRAPKRSGALARSTTGRAASGNVAQMTATVVYAGVIHNGWPRHHISPQPYLRDTLEATQSSWLSMYERELQSIVNQVKGA